TMACIAEALGSAVPGSASPPAVTADRMRAAEASGAAAVRLARERLTIDRILTPAAFHNALRVLLAIGGSTNAVVHMAAIAGRMGLRLDLDALDRLGRDTPVLMDLKPAGAHYMEDFHAAGGMATLLRELRPLLRLDALTVTGRTLGEELDAAPPAFPQPVVRPLTQPLFPNGGLAVLRGNLAPGGAIVKPAAADAALLEHEGRAVVFEDLEDMAARIDRDDLDVRPDDVLVLRRIGPKGAPGMPEAGMLPIPRKLARAGVKDMVRISDGRMSGTAFGTVVLHVTPEAAVGGPLALVRTGDRIRLSLRKRALTLCVEDTELARRAQALPPAPAPPERGYRRLFMQSVLQADEGADFDFLRPPQENGSVPDAG
ncbi:MAG: dihydroxy-acid dehydratase, partial [Rubrivivax sp.]